MVAALSSNFGLIGFIVSEIVQFFQIFAFWLETAYSRPLLWWFKAFSLK